MEQLVAEFFQDKLMPWSGKLALSVLIFFIGRWLSSAIVKLLRTVLHQATLDETLIGFVCSIARALLLLAVVIAALGQLGVDTTALIALVGAAGLAIGLALKDSLANFAAGFMLIVFRPFRIGDSVEAAGTSGSVDQITIFSTKINTFDNKAVFIPNGEIYQGKIINYSSNPTRRLDLVVSIDYEDDLHKAKKLLQQLVERHELALQDPAPVIAVGALADSSVDLELRVWTLSENFLDLKFSLLEQIKSHFDQDGITLPFPQLNVHLNREAA